MFFMPIEALQHSHPFARFYLHSSATKVDRGFGRGIVTVMFPLMGFQVVRAHFLLVPPYSFMDHLAVVQYDMVKLNTLGLTGIKH